MTYNQILIIAYAASLVVMSLITFCLFKKDKKMANGTAVRIKEKSLLACCCIGGAIGGFLGRIICHHKTEKGYFSLVIYFSLLCQVAVLVLLILIEMGVLA